MATHNVHSWKETIRNKTHSVQVLIPKYRSVCMHDVYVNTKGHDETKRPLIIGVKQNDKVVI